MSSCGIPLRPGTISLMSGSNTQMRVPPHNTEAERALLGSILVRPEGIYEVIDSVVPDSFYNPPHRIIFDAMLELHGRNAPIDLVALTNRLSEKKSLSQAGGDTYLAELVSQVPSSKNVAYYARVVADKSALRGLIDAGSDVAELGFAEERDVETVLDEAERRVFRVTQTSQGGNRFVGMKEVLPGVMDNITKMQDSDGGMRGVPTGLASLDNKLSGLQKSDLIILAARPSMGKTALALDIARRAALLHDQKVGVFSLEMSSEQLVDRMLAAESAVDSWKLRTGKALSEQEFDRLRSAMDSLSRAPIFIDDMPGNSILRMRSTARRLKREHGLDLIIVDYLQLMTTSRQYDSVVHQVSDISRSLKGLARELAVPVLCLSQLSRAVEARGGKPRLSDLRDSGAIEQDADVVMFIHREDRYREDAEKTNIAEILIEKHRNGPTGRVELYFDDAKTTFVDMGQTSGYEDMIPAPAADAFDTF